VNDENISSLKNVINDIVAGGETNIYSGI